MTEISGPFVGEQWDTTHVTTDHGFAVGDRVTWLDSLDWGDHWEHGTITLITDVGFNALKEVHTLASVAWDNGTASREGLTPRGPFGMYPVTIKRTGH